MGFFDKFFKSNDDEIEEKISEVSNDKIDVKEILTRANRRDQILKDQRSDRVKRLIKKGQIKRSLLKTDIRTRYDLSSSEIAKKALERYEQKRRKKEPIDETVVRILKGDFEKKFGITFEDFIEAYNDLLENNPEKLI